MHWLTRLALAGCIMLLGLFVIEGAWYLQAAYVTAVMGLFLYLSQLAVEPHQRLQQQQQEIERLTQVCEELDQNTRLIVQTDLELTRTQEALDKKIGGLYTLHELSQKLIAIQSIPSLLALITEALVTKLGFERAVAVLGEPATRAVEARAAQGYSDEDAAKLDWPALLTEGAPSARLGTLCGVPSFAAAPIVVAGRPAGLILIGSNPPYDPVEPGDAELLATLASEAAVAIENIRLYDEIRRSHQELEQRVKERTRELAEANEELRRLNKMKSDFVSAVSHELRTPLTTIKGYASVLATGKLGPVTKDQQERLAKIDHHSDYLTSLINDLLDIARIESGRVGMEFSRVDLAKVFEGVMELVAPQLQSREIALKTQLPARLPKIPADPRYLERVFLNLLSNALKFTPARGTITVTATPDRDHLTVRVRDSGIGIAPQDLPKVFEEFYRADNPINRERKGTGLGLSLVKQIVEAHGGRIWVESTVGHGATFTFTLPLTPPPAGPPKAGGPGDRPSGPPAGGGITRPAAGAAHAA